MILRPRHASENFTCLYLKVSASVLITLRFVHSRSTCVGGTCRTGLSMRLCEIVLLQSTVSQKGLLASMLWWFWTWTILAKV